MWSIIAGVRCLWANKYRHNEFWLFSDRWQAHGDQKPPSGQQSKMVIYCQKQLPPKTATNGHLMANFSKKSVRCFKTAWSQLQIRPKIVFQFKKLTNWWRFAWISCRFFINLIPNTHSKEYVHLKRIWMYLTYLDLFFTCWVVRVGMELEINQNTALRGKSWPQNSPDIYLDLLSCKMDSPTKQLMSIFDVRRFFWKYPLWFCKIHTWWCVYKW